MPNLTFSKPKRKTRKYKKKTMKPKMKLTKAISQVLARKIETKRNSLQGGSATYNGFINILGDQNYLIPPLQIGTGDNNRIGSKVQPIKMVIRGHVIHNPIAANVNPRIFGIRLFCYQDKAVRSYATWQIAGASYNLLDLGGVSASFNGTIAAFESPNNSDQFTFFKDKRHTMLKPLYVTNATATGMTSIHSSMYMPFVITLTKKDLPANFIYDANTSDRYPVNFCPFLSVGYCDLTGNTIDGTDLLINMAWTSTIYYKDA